MSMHQFLLDGDPKSLDCVKDVTLSASVLCDCQKWELRQLPSAEARAGVGHGFEKGTWGVWICGLQDEQLSVVW